MNPKTTLAMGVTLVVVFATLAVLKIANAPTQKDIEGAQDHVVAELHDVDADDAKQVTLSREKERFEFAYSEAADRWQMTKPLNVLAQASGVRELFNDLKNLRRATGRGKDEKAGLFEPKTAGDLIQYGLDSPKYAVTVTYRPKGSEKDTKSVTLEVGGLTGDKEAYYVKLTSKPFVYVVSKTSLRSIAKKIGEFRQQKLVTISRYESDRLSLEWPDRKLLAEKKDSKSKWRLVEPIDDRADEDKLGELIAKLGELKADGDADYVDDAAEDLAKYGLDSPQLVVELRKPGSDTSDDDEKKSSKKKGKTKDKPTIVEKILIGKPVEDREDRRYAKIADQNYVVAVAASAVDELAKQPNELRSRDLVELTQGDVDFLRIERPGGDVTLAKKDRDWDLFQPGKIRAEQTAVTDLVRKIDELDVKEFIDRGDPKEFGLDQPAVRVAIYQKGLKADDADSKDKDKKEKKDKEKQEEPSDAAPEPKGEPVRVAFGNRDDEKKLVYVRRGDEPTIFGVASDGVWDVVDRDYLAYRRKQVLTFLEADVSKLVVHRDGKSFAVERKKEKEGDTKETWRLTEPLDAAADSTSISDILFSMTRLNAKKFYAENEADLAKYGLDDPKIRATVTLKASGDKEPEQHVLLVGSTEEGGAHYAKLGKDDLIFSIEPMLVSYLKSELFSHSLLRFDSAKAESLTLTWPEAKLELSNQKPEDKSAKEWSVVGNDEFKLDAGKFREFLTFLANLNSDQFAQYDGEFTETQGLAAPSLVVEIKLEGESISKTLRVGAAADGEQRFAATGEKSGPVALLAESRIKDYLAGPAHFAVAEEPKPEQKKPDAETPADAKKDDKPATSEPSEAKTQTKPNENSSNHEPPAAKPPEPKKEPS